MLTGDLPNLANAVTREAPNFVLTAIPSMLQELVVYPGNPGLKGAVHSWELPLDTLRKLVIGSSLSIHGEDPENPNRLCAGKADFLLQAWVERSDTIFTGAICGERARDERARDEGSAGGFTTRLGRIQPGISNLRVRTGDDVTLSINIYGRQGIQDQSLAKRVTFEWK